MLWFKPRQELSPLLPPPWQDGETIGAVKVRKLVGWDKNSLISKAKGTHRGKAKQGVDSPLTMAGRCSAIPDSRAPSQGTEPGEDNHHRSKNPHLSPSPPALCGDRDTIWCGVFPGVSWGQCPGCVPSQLPVSPQPPGWQCGVRSRTGLGSPWAPLSFNENTPGYQHKSKPQPHTSYCKEMNSVPAKPSTLWLGNYK